MVAVALAIATAARAQPAPVEATPPPPVIVPPELIAGADPTYPPDAFAEDVSGSVVLDVDVDEEGRVQRCAVKASPDPRLSFAALGAVTNFELLPAQQRAEDGSLHPVPVRFEYVMHFQIDEVERTRLLSLQEATRLQAERETAPVNLRGRVYVRGEAAPVAGAHVSIVGSDIDAVTDAQGGFEIRAAPNGLQQMDVDATGFLPATVSETLSADVVVDVRIYLERRVGADNETVVSARRTQREVTKRALSQQELVRVPGTFGDAIRVVQRLPGVQRAPFGLGALLVRGGSPNDSVVMIDGHVARVLFHLGAGPSVINSDLVESLDLYPGGQGVRFGRAIAGAVEVNTRDPRTDVFSGKATVDLLQTGVRLEGPLPCPEVLCGLPAPGETTTGKLGFALAMRTSYVAEVLNVGDVISRFADTSLNALTLAPRYRDYQAKLVWKLPYGNSLALNVYGSDDVLDLVLDPSQLGPAAPTNVGISLGFHRVNPVWRFQSAARNTDGSPQLRAWVSPMLETNYSENRFDVSQFRLDVTRAALRTEVELRPVAYAGLLVGLDAAPAHFVSTVDVPSVLPNERLFPRPAVSDPPRFLLSEAVDGGSNAFYVQGDVTWGPLLVTAGVRAELGYYYDEIRTSLDPRAMVRLDVTRQVTLKASAGLYHQLPTPFQLANEFGNPNLPLEQGVQGSAGAEVALSRALSLDVQWFGRNTWDIAETVISPLRFLATSAPRIQSTGHGRAFGAEVLLRQQLDKTPFAGALADATGAQWGKSFGWVAYTLLRSEERSDKPAGIPDGLATGWRSTSFDQTDIVSIAASTELPALPAVGSFEIGGAFRYVTGNPATLAQGGIYDADTSRSIRISEPELGSRLPDFIQLDLRVDKRWRFTTWSLSAFLDLQNATNRQNFELFQYNHDFTEVQGFPGLPILPVFGAEASF